MATVLRPRNPGDKESEVAYYVCLLFPDVSKRDIYYFGSRKKFLEERKTSFPFK